MTTLMIDGKTVQATEVTPSYSRSGGRVYLIDNKFYVPQIDAQFPSKFFDTLESAWGYCETAYYSWN